MDTTEEYIFQQHLRNLNTKWEDFSNEIKSLQTPDTFSIIYATDIHSHIIPTYEELKTKNNKDEIKERIQNHIKQILSSKI